MKSLKVIVIIVLLMSVFTMFIVPMESGLFPSWIDTDLIQFMLILLCVVCAVVLIP